MAQRQRIEAPKQTAREQDCNTTQHIRAYGSKPRDEQANSADNDRKPSRLAGTETVTM